MNCVTCRLPFAVTTMILLVLACVTSSAQSPPDRVQSEDTNPPTTSGVTNPVPTMTALTAPPSSSLHSIGQAYGELPLVFEVNQGQADSTVQCISRGDGYTLFLKQDEAVLALYKTEAHEPRTREPRGWQGNSGRFGPNQPVELVHVAMRGTNPAARIEPSDALPGKSNYFIGNDPKKWVTGVSTYQRVKYSDLYPGVDLIYYGNRRNLEFDFVVAPGGDPTAIRLQIDSRGRLRIAQDGSLQVDSPGGVFTFHRPDIYQEVNGKKRLVEGGFSLKANNEVGFRLATYDRRRPIVIDPVLAYSTHFAGSSDDRNDGVAADAEGNAYLVGTAMSANFPTLNGYVSSANPNGIAILTKLNPAGTSLLYSTYIGGSGGEYGYGVAAGSNGKVYITGLTFSPDFPVVGGFQTSTGTTAGNAFVAEIDTTQAGQASLVYSTYLGGGGNRTNPSGDFAAGIAVDAAGLVYVTGQTTSDTSIAPFPTTSSAYQSALASLNGNAFLTVLDTSQSGAASLRYSTYLGGGGSQNGSGDWGVAVAVDGAGNAYITGGATSGGSTPFPTTPGAYQASLNSQYGQNGFVAEIATTQSGPQSLVYSTYLGGSSTDNLGDQANAIALDSTGKVYVAGVTTSTDFPVTPGAYQTSCSAARSAFVTKLDLTQTGTQALVYSTCLGGSHNGALGFSLAVDANGNAYVAGTTSSPDFPITSGAVLSAITGSPWKGFLTELNAAGTGVLYSTYLGGTSGYGTSGDGCSANGDQAWGVALDGLGNLYVSGITCSTNFPVYPSNAYSTPLTGYWNPFIVKFTMLVSITVSPQNSTIFVGNTQQFTATGVYSDGSSQDLTATANWSSTATGVAAITNSGLATAELPGNTIIQARYGSVSATTTLTVMSPPPLITTLSLSAATLMGPYSAVLAASGGQPPYTWSISAGALPAGLSLNPSTGAITGTPTTAGTSNFTVQVTDAGGSAATQPLSLTVNAPLAVTTTTLPGGTQNVSYTATLAATGGTGAYTWSLASGSLPAGLSLSANTAVISGIPTTGGTSNFTVQVTDTSSSTATQPLSISIVHPHLNSYASQRTITIDHTKVPNTDQPNFPVLISGTYSYLATVPNGGEVQNANGWDIIFTPDATCGNKLKHEIDSYNGTTGAAAFWVQIPILSHTVDTTIYMCYGNGSITTSQEDSTLWADAGYVSVYHFGNGSTLSLNDSTGTNNLTGSGLLPGAGVIGLGALKPNGNSATSSSPAGLPTGAAVRSISTWVYLTDTSIAYSWGSIGYGDFSACGRQSFDFLKAPPNCGGTWYAEAAQCGAPNFGFHSLETGWHRLDLVLPAGVSTANSLLAYYDGVLQPHSCQSNGAINTGTSVPTLLASSAYFEPGAMMDEERFATVAKTADWIATEYANQTSPAAFYGMGSEQAVRLAVSSTSLPNGLINVPYSATLAAINGAVPYTWSVVAGSLPAGLSLNPTAGTITGTPTSIQTSTFTVQVADANSNTATQPLSITIAYQYPNGYSYQRVITIEHAKVANTDQRDFPVLISGTYPFLANVSNGGVVQNGNGWDIIFTSDLAGQNKLDHEIDTYNSKTGTANFWVRIPLLSHTADTKIYMWYGNSGVTASPENKAGVWKNGYAGVWHFGNGAPLSAQDSTVNANNGTVNGSPTAVSGEIGVAADFAGSNDDIGIRSIPLNGVDYTVSAWFSTPLPNNGGWNTLTRGATNDHQVLVNESNWHLGAYYNQGPGFLDSGFAVNSLPAGWHYVAAAATGGNTTYYVDGTFAGTIVFLSAADIGFLGNCQCAGQQFGIVDEIRVSTGIARSADWIATEYANQSAAASFYGMGSEQSGQLAVSTSLPGGFLAAPYSATLTAIGGTAPYSWSLTAGSLPAGLSLNAGAGTITGTPAASGTSTFTVQVTDANSHTASQPLSITIAYQYPNGYSYQRAITIDHTKVPNTDQQDFPALVSGTYPFLAIVAHGGEVQNANGWDIIFTSDMVGQNKLDHEIDTYNPATGVVVFWVRIPLLSHTMDTTIYLWYGNAGITASQENKAGVWKNGYAGVYHLGVAQPSADSTGANSGANYGMTSTTGVIGGAAAFNGGTSFMTVPAGAANYPTSGSTTSYNLTFSTWFKTASTGVILGQDDGATPGGYPSGYVPGIYVDTTGHIRASLFWHGSVEQQVVSTGTYNDNQWHSLVDTYSNGVETLYVDGLVLESQNAAELSYASPYSYFLGTCETNGWPNTPGGWSYLNGTLDEIRFSSAARSADWIATEYANQSSPATFYGVGGEQSGQLAVVTTTLPVAQYAVPYTTTLSSIGGTPPYSWSVISGALPTGLSLSGTGTISGTPTSSGTGTFTVQVQDANSRLATQTLSITVYAPLAVTTGSLASGIQGSAYSATLAASGGTPPYTWSISSGSLPQGLTLVAGTGVIAGTPTASGTSAFTVQVTDANSNIATQPLSITIGTLAPLTITTTALPGGTSNVSYSVTLTATGGTPPYSWSTASGSLPAGLSLNASTGIISGTPAGSGNSTFSVQLTDANSNTATQLLSIAIAYQTPLSSVAYTYDSQGRIKTATYTTSSGTITVTYTYDNAGNRTSVVTQ
jgi:hypothetical protein